MPEQDDDPDEKTIDQEAAVPLPDRDAMSLINMPGTPPLDGAIPADPTPPPFDPVPKIGPEPLSE